MKIILKTFCLLFSLTMLFASCKKYYESVPVETVTSDFIWDITDSNGIYARQYLFTIYNALPDGANRINGDFLDAGSDDAISSKLGNSAISLLATGGITIFNNPDNFWTESYAAIRKATDFLNNFGKVPLSNAYERRAWFGEARALRAYFYWELVKRYGGVPILSDSIGQLNDDFQVPRSSFERCVNFIVSECNRSIDSLRGDPADANSYGRITKDGARALKAHVLLYAASPLYNGGNIGDTLNGYTNYDANRWQLAADAAKTIIDSGHYSLQSSFVSTFTVQQSTEVIFVKTNTPGTYVENQNGPINFATAPGIGNTSPTQELVDVYGMSNGKSISDPTSGYNPDSPYNNRDPRFNYTILYNGARWLNSSIQTYNGGPQRPGGTTQQTRTGYYMRKFMGDFTNSNNYENHYHDWVYFRYAEMLLDYAEAKNEFSGPSDSVYNFIEQIRKRAGLNPFTVSRALSKDSLRTVIRDERRKEMAFEEQRFWDVRRWKIAGSVLNKTLHGISIANTGSSLVYEVVPVLQTVFDESKSYFYPIPYQEVVSNVNMRQNPGW